MRGFSPWPFALKDSDAYHPKTSMSLEIKQQQVRASFRNPLSCSARTEIPSGKCQSFGDTIPCNTTHLRQSGAHQ